ncbi:tetratricopeptide repeat protein [Nocardiopsis sp. CC223A]|uniref:tetratricopeptide repeat protein n=1 Tax=Nocardiopsis sp. CC223A TaxID=3044051 RepID=UPI00278BFF1C|nr:tetratricopeptide repeat protein [Nocardiopsis sp. CC223A]
MPDQALPEAKSLLAFGVGTYASAAYDTLPTAIPQVEKLAELLNGSGYAEAVVTDPASADDVEDACTRWAARWRSERDRGPAVLVWSGHAARGPRLILTGTTTAGTPRQVHLSALTEYLTARTDAAEDTVPVPYQRLVIIDTCYSGDGVTAQIHQEMERLKETSQPEGAPHSWLGYVASCWPQERAEGEGALINTINHLLEHGLEPDSEHYSIAWSTNNPVLTGNDLLDAVGRAWRGPADNTPVPVTAGTAGPMFHNPRWEPPRPRLIDDHLAEAARSGGSIATDEWFFTGRRAVLEQITDWMADPTPGLCLVTGPAGSGKSAVAGHLAALSNPDTRAQVRATPGWDTESPDPGEGSVYTTLHLRGLDANGIAQKLAKALGVPAPKTSGGLVEEIEKTPRESAPLVILDGLDEALSNDPGKDLVSGLIQPLSGALRVLLTSRPMNIPVQNTGEDGQTQHTYRRLRGLLAQQGVSERPLLCVDLAEQQSTGADIRQYLIRRLSRIDTATAEQVHAVADTLVAPANEDDGGFLFARITVDWLSRRTPSQWADRLPATVTEAFDADISTLASDPVPRELLEALAWGQGRGVPVDIWCAITSTLHPGQAYGRADIERCLVLFRRYIIEDGDGEQPIYRLFHLEFVQHLRRMTPSTNGRPPEEAIAAKLADLAREILDAAGEDSPDALPQYLWAHLVEHTQEAGYRGVSVLHELAEHYPQTFLLDLAMVLNNLAVFLVRVGRHEEALTHAHEAANLYRTLAEQTPAAHLPELAESLNNLASQLAAVGQHKEALTHAREAADLYRTLTEQTPAAHLPELAIALDTLASQLAAVGQHKEALTHARLSVTIRRTLAEQTPAAHLPSLAGSLNNLANRLAEVGRHEEALTHAHESVTIRRTLTEQTPAAHLPELAMGLNNLANHLAEVGRHEEALTHIHESVTIRRTLAEQDPTTYLPNLAGSLKTLAVLLAKLGQHEEALTSYDSVIQQFSVTPQWGHLLRFDKASFCFSYGDDDTGLGELLSLAAEETLTSASVQSRQFLRGPARPAIQNALGDQEPLWMQITAQVKATVLNWVGAPTWSDSQLHLENNKQGLFEPPVREYLREMATDFAQANLYITILDMSRKLGIENAYLTLSLHEHLTKWRSTPDWEASEQYLTTHADLLLRPESLVGLHSQSKSSPAESGEISVHIAILTISRSQSINEAFRIIHDADFTREQAEAAVRAGDPIYLHAAAVLAGAIHHDSMAMFLYLALSQSLADTTEENEQVREKLRTFAHEADKSTREHAIALVTEAITVHPAKAPQLVKLLTAIPNPEHE